MTPFTLAVLRRFWKVHQHPQLLFPNRKKTMEAVRFVSKPLDRGVQKAIREVHRHCPHCQQHDSQSWIDQQLKRRVKGNYVMNTFTIPAEFRSLFYTHQKALYTLLFGTIWETLQTFSQNDKQLQGTPGAIAVLHTHSRKLDYHPHIHVIMPMAAFNKNIFFLLTNTLEPE